MKTRSELVSKWWYRLIKVAFIGLVLTCIILTILIITDENRPRRVGDYMLSCVADYANHKTAYIQRDLHIYIFPYGDQTLYDALSDADRIKIRNTCDISQDETDVARNKAIAYIDTQEKIGTSKDLILEYINSNMRPYTISSMEITEGSYISVILYSILSIIIILMIAEIVRRVFYYVFLGSLKPGK